MKFNQELSLLEELSDQDQELISGGNTTISILSSRAFGISINGVSSGGGETSTTVTVNGVVVEEDRKSYSFIPTSKPFSFSFSDSLPRNSRNSRKVQFA